MVWQPLGAEGSGVTKKILDILQTSVLKKYHMGKAGKGLKVRDKWEEGLTAGRNSLCAEIEMGPE